MAEVEASYREAWAAVERLPSPEELAEARDAAAHETAAALQKAAVTVAGWWPPLPLQPSYRDLLASDRQLEGSLSLGTTSEGCIVNAVELPVTGPHHSIIDRHRGRGTRYGTQEMVAIIQHGAAAVAARHGGAPLRVGNISRRPGGWIRWSNSHHAGRDADLAFYCVRAKDGTSVPAPDLLSFDDEGGAVGRPDLRFDVPRNWALVEALLTHEEVVVQWLFISEGLKSMLLDYAEANQVAPDVLERARFVLHQPTDAPPHADHFHLRIACSKRDRLEGCIDAGPRWRWADWHDAELLSRSLELARALDEPDVELRLAALDFLERIRSPYGPEIALTRGIHDRDPQVRRRAVEVAAAIPAWSATAILGAQRLVDMEGTSDEELDLAYSIFRRNADPMSRAFVLERLLSEDIAEFEKVLAARALSHAMEAELVPLLIEQLREQPGAVRQEIAQVLHRITNRSLAVDWQGGPEPEIEQAIGDWQDWWNDNQGKEREVWLAESLGGYIGRDEEDWLGLDAIDELIALLPDAPDHVAYNVNAVLHKLTHRWAPREEIDGTRLFRFWSKWWRRNKERMLEKGRPNP